MPDDAQPDLIDEYREMHRHGHFRGYTVLNYAEKIGRICKETGSHSLIDYGCGKGEAYMVHQVHLVEGWPPARPWMYDPAVPEFAHKPNQKADGVLCVDVLEHVAEEDVPRVIAELFSLARKFVFVTVATKPAKKFLPSGRNCHVTIKPHNWWLDKIYEKAPEGLRIEVEWTDE